MKTCFLCGAAETAYNRLERHHAFPGVGRRKKCERDGLTVDLCHSCHNEPPRGVHFNRENMERVQRWAQEKAMRENGWTVEQFILEYGKNYL